MGWLDERERDGEVGREMTKGSGWLGERAREIERDRWREREREIAWTNMTD